MLDLRTTIFAVIIGLELALSAGMGGVIATIVIRPPVVASKPGVADTSTPVGRSTTPVPATTAPLAPRNPVRPGRTPTVLPGPPTGTSAADASHEWQDGGASQPRSESPASSPRPAAPTPSADPLAPLVPSPSASLRT